MSKTKRLLSLVLALAMVFALFAMSGVANADETDTTTEVTSSTVAVEVTSGEFTDFAEITYKDAVSVLQYIDVLKGYDDGTYKPTATLTRAEGAAIINRLITASDAGSLVATDFSDVDRTHWASGYIAWGTKNNILNGYGNGSFGPSDTLTVLQFLKMLLTGLGWGASAEYVGPGWDTNVVVDASRLGLWGAVDSISQDRNISREEAAEFSLQTLKQIPVYYGNAAYHYTNSTTGVNTAGTNYDRALYVVHDLYYEYEIDDLGYLNYFWTSVSNGDVLAADKIAPT
ncbi:MAG: S-layer homology domain-containing protein, partial [Oscillospiraceae bacterium]|nr:S-layer homology domain-containing protein [Oscillospiraceae bacterium]